MAIVSPPITRDSSGEKWTSHIHRMLNAINCSYLGLFLELLRTFIYWIPTDTKCHWFSVDRGNRIPIDMILAYHYKKYEPNKQLPDDV